MAEGGILIIGATRGTGLEVARRLAGLGEPFSVLVRPTSDRAALDALGPRQVFVGDLLDPESVRGALAAAPLRAVVCTVGGRRGQKAPRPDHAGVQVLVEELLAMPAPRPRLVLVTMVGAGDSRDLVPAAALPFLGEAMELKTLAEDCLRASGLEHVILRPGGLHSGAATGKAIRSSDRRVMGSISRADLARLVIECVDDPAAANQTWHALDPSASS